MAVDFVYADCAATAPMLGFDWSSSDYRYANPNSTHKLGRIAREDLEYARSVIAECINAKPEQIAFTPSATSACHTAVSYLNITDCSPYEHKSVWEPVEWDRLFVCGDDRSTAHILASNETGERFDSKVRALAKEKVVFTDATAAVGQITVNVQWLGVAALAAGAHKFGGPPGIGFLYLREGITDESAYPGTPPVALAVAMATALKYRMNHMIEANVYLMEQTDRLAESLLEIPGCHINTPMNKRLPNILSVRFDGVDARELLTMLDISGVYASAGAACNSHSDEPSAVLLASALTEEQARQTIRLSFCPETSEEDFRFVAEAVSRCVSNFRNLTK